MARITIKDFAKKYFDITLAKHQIVWIRFLEKTGKWKLLLAPRGHGKTTIVNLIYLAWLIANNPKLHILVVSHSKQQAEEFSLSIRRVFEREDIQEDFGIEPSTPWRANSWTLRGSRANKPTLRVVGVMGKMTGWRGDIIIFDDVLEITAVANEEKRKKIVNWINSEVLFALNPSDNQKVIVVGTRKHIDDWYGELIKKPHYDVRIDKAIRANGTLLWPDVYNKQVLDDIKENQGSIYFSQEMMNEPTPPEGLDFKVEWLKYYEHLPLGRTFDYYIGFDPSHGSTTKRASWFSYAVVAHDKITDKIYVVELFRDKMSQESQVIKAVEVVDKYDAKGIYVEAVFNYTFLFKALRERFVNVHEKDYIHTKIKGTSAVSKIERIKNVCGPPIETGRILFKDPRLDYYTKVFVENEYIPFPTGKDFDIFDALTLATHHLTELKMTKMPFYFPR